MDNVLYLWDRMHQMATRIEQMEARIKELEKTETTADNLARRSLTHYIQDVTYGGRTNEIAKRSYEAVQLEG